MNKKLVKLCVIEGVADIYQEFPSGTLVAKRTYPEAKKKVKRYNEFDLEKVFDREYDAHYKSIYL